MAALVLLHPIRHWPRAFLHLTACVTVLVAAAIAVASSRPLTPGLEDLGAGLEETDHLLPSAHGSLPDTPIWNPFNLRRSDVAERLGVLVVHCPIQAVDVVVRDTAAEARMSTTVTTRNALQRGLRDRIMGMAQVEELIIAAADGSFAFRLIYFARAALYFVRRGDLTIWGSKFRWSAWSTLPWRQLPPVRLSRLG